MGQRRQLSAPRCQETLAKPPTSFSKQQHEDNTCAVLGGSCGPRYLLTKKYYANISWPFVAIVALVS